MKRGVVRLAVLGVVLLASAACVLGEQTCQITVHEGMSLQAAISLAPAGAVVCLGPGAWHENITIAKSITLRGAGANGQTTISGSDAGSPVIRVEGNEETSVAIVGIDVTWGSIGIAVVGSARATVDNSEVSLCGYGVAVAGSSQATITGSSVLSCISVGIYVTDFARASISTTEVRSTQGFAAINVDASAYVSITASTIADSGYTGVWLGATAQADIADTHVEDNGHDGIAVGGSARVAISDSTIVRNGWRGIALGDSPYAVITGNRVAGNSMYGVFLYEAPCAETDRLFTGFVTGANNDIADEYVPAASYDPNAIGGNEWGAFCPSALGFLRTETGGELDRRQPTS